MAFDGLFCAAVAQELNEWAGARVEKIHQSSPSCFFFQLYKNGRHGNFVVSASASRPILAITEESVARPDTPTPTAMLYRKHIQNGRFSGAEWVENERIVRFSFDSADDMGFVRRKYLYAEMMGKFSNIILTEESGKIISASSTSDITSSVRRILPGLPYELPPRQDKKSLFSTDFEEFSAICGDRLGLPACDLLLKSYLGFSPVTAREVAYSAFGTVDKPVYPEDVEALYKSLSDFRERIKGGDFTPNAVYDSEGEGIAFSFIPLRQYGCDARGFDSFSEMLTEYFGKKEESVNISRFSRELERTVGTHLARVRKKLTLLRDELSDCQSMESVRQKGDIITANIYRIRQGDGSVTAMNYETGLEQTVALDISLTPAKNAQKYYKKYSKMKRASVMLAEQIERAEKDADYLEGVLGFIARAGSPAELDEIRAELSLSGYIAEKSGNKKKKTPASKPLSFTTTDGLTVRVGRNNRQNDSLTGSAERNDLWFHIKGFHGSHVILTVNGSEEPTDRDYTESAMLAAYFSEKRGSKNVEVDYTRVRCLKKPTGSPFGFVTYEKYYSAVVDAENPFEKR